MGVQSFIDSWLSKARAGIAVTIAGAYVFCIISSILIFKDPQLMQSLIETDKILGMVVILLVGGTD